MLSRSSTVFAEWRQRAATLARSFDDVLRSHVLSMTGCVSTSEMNIPPNCRRNPSKPSRSGRRRSRADTPAEPETHVGTSAAERATIVKN
jgi:hypothetical protein